MTCIPTNSDDLIYIRDVIARFEALETDIADNLEDAEESIADRQVLQALLDECRGNGGDEQWRGDWYPVTLIRDSYFQTYAQELAEDIGAINADATWPNTCIDWAQAARELMSDYTGIEFDGVTYYTR